MRTIGVLGGMGPAAGADFYARIVAAHGAMRDQDHPPCVMYSATQVPDRTAYLLGGGADPAPELAAAVRLLESAGADFIAIPCNSAHAFLPAMRAAVAIPVLDMIALAAAAVARVVPQAQRVGILAASGTVDIALYDAPVAGHGMETVYPDPAVQEEVMAAIQEIKAGGVDRASDPRLVAAAAHLAERGVDCIVMGCTEIPLALAAADSPVVLIDGNQTLVDAALALAIGRADFEELAHALR